MGDTTIKKNLAKESLDIRDKLLDEYEAKLGLPSEMELENLEEFKLYFTMGRDTIEKLTKDACAEISFRLAQYAFHLQKAQNRESSRMVWAENEIKKTIASKINNYQGYGYVEKSMQAIKDDSHASKLNEIVIYAKQRVERLNFLATSVKNLSDTMKSILYNKEKNNE